MISSRSLLIKLGKRFPRHLALKNRDPYVGHQVGQMPLTISKILLCLDFDLTVLEEVKIHRPDLVITHHPFIYGLKAKVFANDPVKALIAQQMEEMGIPVYSYHTNFDEAAGGMNDALALALGLENITPLASAPMARGGELPTPLPIDKFAKFALRALNVDYGLLIDEGSEVIRKVAIIGGGGSRSWYIAKDEGYDIYLSGDVPHHVRRDIVESRYNYLDLPHEVERIFMPTMKKILLEIDEDLEIVIVNHEQLPKVIR